MIESLYYMNFGQPSLEGRRLTVHNIVHKLYLEESMEVVLEEYDITIADVKDAIEYCMHLKCKEDAGLTQFCYGCVLRTLDQGSTFDFEDFKEDDFDGQTMVVSKDRSIFVLGTMAEFIEEDFGKQTWLIAKELNESICK